MKTSTTILLCIAAAALIFCIVAFIISAAAAKKDGIIRAVFPLDIKWTVPRLVLAGLGVCMVFGYANEAAKLRERADDWENRGIAAYAEYYGVEVDSLTDVAYANHKLKIANDRKRAQEKQDMSWFYIAFTLCWTLTAALNGAFITKKGVREFATFKNKTALMKAKDGKLLLYEENLTAPILKLPDSKENRERFAGLGISETAASEQA